MEPKFLNHKQASIYLGLSETTVYIKVSRGKIPVYKIKGSHLNRYKVSDLDNLTVEKLVKK